MSVPWSIGPSIYLSIYIYIYPICLSYLSILSNPILSYPIYPIYLSYPIQSNPILSYLSIYLSI